MIFCSGNWLKAIETKNLLQLREDASSSGRQIAVSQAVEHV